jgi:uncharacterized membrane protein (DUF485 family)
MREDLIRDLRVCLIDLRKSGLTISLVRRSAPPAVAFAEFSAISGLYSEKFHIPVTGDAICYAFSAQLGLLSEAGPSIDASKGGVTGPRGWAGRTRTNAKNRVRRTGDKGRTMHNNLASDLVRKVQSDPTFQELERKRRSFAWTLAIATLVIYYGYVAMLAWAKPFLATQIGDSVVTYAFPIGLFVLVAAILITAVYVHRANGEYEALTAKIKENLR